MRRSKLIWVLLFALVGLLAANWTADLLRIKYYHPRSRVWSQNLLAYQQSDLSAHILFLGDSSVRWGVRPRLIASELASGGLDEVDVYSVAQPAGDVFRNSVILHDLISSNGCPEIVVVQISPRSLARHSRWWLLLSDLGSLRDVPTILPSVSTLDQLNDLLGTSLRGMVRLFDYVVYPPDPAAIQRHIDRRGRSNDRKRLRPWSRHRTRTTRTRKRASRADGQAEPQREVEPSPQRGRPLIERGRRWRYELGGVPERALQKVGRLAVGCEADLILLRMPKRSLIKEGRVESRSTAFGRDLLEFGAEYDATFVDYYEIDLPLRRGHFLDPTHLHRDGAAVVSTHLTKTYLAPLIRMRRGL